MRWMALIGCLLMYEVACAAPATGPLRTLMEKPALNGGWTRSGKAEFYDKDTLFDLVDGEAEAYFPYGFQGALSAIYTQGGDMAKEVRVEVYEMGSLLDAYGIYSTMREIGSTPVDVGTEGIGGTTQIMFYADKYLVKILVYSSAAGDALLSIAKAVACELPTDKKKPTQLALVAIPDLVPQSDQYIGQSVLGYACWPRGMIAKINMKATSVRIFVVITGSSAAATIALDKYVQEIAGDGRKVNRVTDEGESLLTLNDPMHGGVAVSQAGKYVIGVANLTNPDRQGIPLVRQLRQKVLSAGK